MKKTVRRMISLIIAVMMIAAMAAPAMAGATDAGTITVTSDTKALKEKTLVAYKILDATYSGSGDSKGVAYTVPSYMYSFFNSYSKFSTQLASLTPGTAAYNKAVTDIIATWGNDSTELQDFAEAARDAVKTATGATSYPLTVDAAGTSATVSNVDFGYYVIDDQSVASNTNTVSAVMVDSAVPSATVALKASTPTITDKKIINSVNGSTETTPNDDHTNNAAIGDTVNFEVDTKVPDMRGYNKYIFVVNDTLSAGLTYEGTGSGAAAVKTAQDVKVKVDGTDLKYATDYTVRVENNVLKVVFTDSFFNAYKAPSNIGKSIVITYGATLNNSAAVKDGNTNKVSVVYSNNPATDYTGDPEHPGEPTPHEPVGESTTKETKTYTTALKVAKKDETGNVLTGAEFTLAGVRLDTVLVSGTEFLEDAGGTYYKLDDGTYSLTSPSGYAGKMYKKSVYTDRPTVKAENVSYKGYVDESGNVVFKGLAAGTYTLTESVVPEGYNGIDPLTVTVSFSKPEGSEDYAFKVSTDGTTFTDVDTDGDLDISVTNKKGSVLPTTGGIGTTIFTVIGLILMVGAAVVLITKKRLSNKR